MNKIYNWTKLKKKSNQKPVERSKSNILHNEKQIDKNMNY